MASSEKVRWGILGPGFIAGRLMRDADRASNAAVVAVGSRNRERAAEFASKFGIARVHGSYEALLADPEVDAVYIATPNSLHHPQTMQALAAGKHVLCEKPYTRHPAEVTEAFDAAAAAGLVLMEAFMWRHSTQVRRFMELPARGGGVAIDSGHLQLRADQGGRPPHGRRSRGRLIDGRRLLLRSAVRAWWPERSRTASSGGRRWPARALTGPSPGCWSSLRASSPRSLPVSPRSIARSRRSAARPPS